MAGPVVMLTPASYWRTWLAVLAGGALLFLAAIVALAWWLGPLIIARGLREGRVP